MKRRGICPRSGIPVWEHATSNSHDPGLSIADLNFDDSPYIHLILRKWGPQFRINIFLVKVNKRAGP